MLARGEGFCEQGRCVLWKGVGGVAALGRQLSLHRWYGCLLALISSRAGGERSGSSWRGFAKERLTSGPRCHSGKVVWKRKDNSMVAISEKINAFLLKDFLS